MWPTPWRAAWAWYRQPPDASRIASAAPDAAHRDAFVLFRREFHLDDVPRTLNLRAVCDGRYILLVNGIHAAAGPIRSQDGILAWDQVDIARMVGPGANCLAVVARHYGTPIPWWVPTAPYAELGRGGFALECLEVPGISTAGGWRARRGPWASHPELLFGPPNEELDATALDPRWVETGFDDHAWEPAVVLSGIPGRQVPARIPGTPFQLVEPSPLPAQSRIAVPGRVVMRGRCVGDLGPHRWSWASTDPAWAAGGAFEMVPDDRGFPVSLGANEALLLDLGGVMIGHPTAVVRAPAGARLVMRAAERLDRGMPADHDRRWLHAHVCRGPEDSVEAFERIGLRYLQLSADMPVSILSAGCVEARYPLAVEAEFTCDDPALERTWRMGVRTIEVCATDAFLDCPSREQRAWVGDSYLTSLLVCALSPDTRLVERSLRLAARARRPDGLLSMVAAGDFSIDAETIPDSSLLWILGLHGVHRWTGNDVLLHELLGSARPILDWFWGHVRDRVLQPVPGWVFLDWIPLRTDVPSASLQGLLVLALEAHGVMCARAGDRANADLSRARAATLRRGLAHFIRGGRVLETPDDDFATQHSVALAVLAGAPGIDPAAALRAAVTGERVRYPVRSEEAPRGWVLPPGFDPRTTILATQPFFAHFLHAAMTAAGTRDLLLPSIRRWDAFHGTGDGTFWEVWPGGAETWSHAHAWSSTPTFDLMTMVLGVSPSTPGFQEIRVAPHLGSLSHASGRLPTPRGPVSVDLERSGGGVAGAVELPPGSSGTLERDGLPPVALPPGRTTF
jgi:hypothetical protein